MAIKTASKNAINLIKQFEGCRLTAYRDSVGVLTIGYGTTNADKSITGFTIKEGSRITQAQAESFLEKSVNKKYAPKVYKYSKYNWNQNQFDALVSFAYNIGSIDTLVAHGARTISQISEKMPSYCKAGGKTLPGLVTRRYKEKALFDKPVTGGVTNLYRPVRDKAYTTFVKGVQSALGAKVDGIAGSETLKKTITVSAKKNNRHKVVKVIQVYLNSLGYNCGTADGVAGAKFTSAVKAFQRANGCTPDGEITGRNKTWKKLLKLA